MVIIRMYLREIQNNANVPTLRCADTNKIRNTNAEKITLVMQHALGPCAKSRAKIEKQNEMNRMGIAMPLARLTKHNHSETNFFAS